MIAKARPDQMSPELFMEAVSELGWAEVGDIVEALDGTDFWGDEWLEHAAAEQKKAYVRRKIKQLKGSDGWPVWASVAVTDTDGSEKRVYKQETLFDLEDYRKVIAYHADRSDYHKHMANGYTKRARKRFHVQLLLPFAEEEKQEPPQPPASGPTWLA